MALGGGVAHGSSIGCCVVQPSNKVLDRPAPLGARLSRFVWIRSDGEINVCASANNRCASKYAVPILWADVVVQAIGSHCFHRWRAETQLLLFYLYDMVAPVCLEHYLA